MGFRVLALPLAQPTCLFKELYLSIYIYIYIYIYISIYIYIWMRKKSNPKNKVGRFRPQGRVWGLGFRLSGLGFKGLARGLENFIRACCTAFL